MKSQARRTSRFTTLQGRKQKKSSKKSSQSPTLASSFSEKSLWAHSYKNQPFPKQLRRKLWGKKFQFDTYSDEEEEISAVVQEEQVEGVQKKKKKLPHFKLIADQGEFTSKRNRIRSEFQFRCRERCKSVQSLKFLPQVLQEKKEEDELKRLQRSKISYFKDRNQFNQRKKNSSDAHSDIVSKVQSLQNLYNPSTARDYPQQIQQNEAQQTKSVKLPGQRSIITAEIQKLIVDELDARMRREEAKPQEIEQIIEEEKQQQEVDNVKLNKLRISLEKFQSQSEYLNQLKDSQCVRKSGKDSSEGGSESESGSGGEDQHGTNSQRGKNNHGHIQECQQIHECSASEKSTGDKNQISLNKNL